MIGRMFPPTRLAVDPAIGTQLSERRRRPHVIEAKAAIFWKRRFPKCVPPRVLAGLVVHLSKDVDKSPLFELLQHLTLLFCKVHSGRPVFYIPQVHLVRRDVGIAAKQDVVVR